MEIYMRDYYLNEKKNDLEYKYFLNVLLLQGYWVQEFTIYVYTRPKTQSEDVTLSEEEQTWSRESVLVEKEVGFDHNGPGGQAEDECLLG